MADSTPTQREPGTRVTGTSERPFTVTDSAGVIYTGRLELTEWNDTNRESHDIVLIAENGESVGPVMLTERESLDSDPTDEEILAEIHAWQQDGRPVDEVEGTYVVHIVNTGEERVLDRDDVRQAIAQAAKDATAAGHAEPQVTVTAA